MLAPASPDACLPVRRERAARIKQGRILPESFIEIEDTPGFLTEQGIPGKEPAAMVPGPDGLPAEPAPGGLFVLRINGNPPHRAGAHGSLDNRAFEEYAVKEDTGRDTKHR